MSAHGDFLRAWLVVLSGLGFFYLLDVLVLARLPKVRLGRVGEDVLFAIAAAIYGSWIVVCQLGIGA